MIDPKSLKPVPSTKDKNRIFMSSAGGATTAVYEDQNGYHYILQVKNGRTMFRQVGYSIWLAEIDVELVIDPYNPMEVIERLFKLAVLR